MRPLSRARRVVLSATAVLTLGLGQAGTTHAHGARAGDIEIDHPYATPTVATARQGAVYFRALRNTGRQGDRLLGARTPAAGSVEIHRMTLDGEIMRMRALDALDLPPGADPKVRHGGEIHLMLLDLKAPLVPGARFALTLRFERGGEKEVTVWVQQPHDRGQPAATGHEHGH